MTTLCLRRESLPAPPSWVLSYRPKRLKKPKDGRVYSTPRKRKAMRDARVILERLKRDYGRLSLHEQTRRVVSALREICPFVFEELILHACVDHNWKVVRSCYTHDGGVDGEFMPWSGARFLLQAKRYSSTINPDDLIKFVGVVNQNKAAGGVFMHTGLACEDARFIEANAPDLMLLEGEDLVSFLCGDPALFPSCLSLA